MIACKRFLVKSQSRCISGQTANFTDFGDRVDSSNGNPYTPQSLLYTTSVAAGGTRCFTHGVVCWQRRKEDDGGAGVQRPKLNGAAESRKTPRRGNEFSDRHNSAIACVKSPNTRRSLKLAGTEDGRDA